MRTKIISIVLALIVLVAGCAPATGLPSRAGEYELQAGSVCADGDRYGFQWLDSGNQLHSAKTPVQQVVRGDRNYVEVLGNDRVTLHLHESEPVPACPSDRGRTGWLPIPIPIGGPIIIDRPNTTGRDSGTTESKPSLGIPKSKDAPFTVPGQSGGTGGGSAATGKSTSPLGGQSGGTGSGTGATGKSSGGIKVPGSGGIKIPSIGGGRSFGGRR